MSVPVERPAKYPSRAGRPKAALPVTAEVAVIALKEWLRSHIGDTPLEEVAAAARYCTSAVSTAVGGAELPSWQRVRGIAAAVGAPTEQAHELWWNAALADFRKQNPRPEDPIAYYGWELRKIMLREGLGQNDVLQRMERLVSQDSGLGSAMSRATLGRFLAGKSLPRRYGQMVLLLRVLPLKGDEAERLKNRYTILEAAVQIAKTIRPAR